METEQVKQAYILVFGTPVKEIDSRSLAESLSSLSTSVEEINKSLHTGKEISIVVKPFVPGSFEVPLELIESLITAGLLFSSQSHIISSIPEIIRIFREFVDIKIKLKGRKFKSEPSGNQHKFITENGDNYNTGRVAGDLVINNTTINVAFNRSMNRLAEDEKVNKYELQDRDKKPLVSVKKKEFDYFTLPEQETSQGQRIKEIRTKLSIRKVVFDTTSKWGFSFEGHKISAKILDEKFQELVQTNERFGNGDTLDTSLRIYQVFDETANTFMNEEYEIVKVFKHIPRPQQTTFPLN